MFLNLNADNMSALELTDYAERYVVDQLATVPGVSRVGVGGGRRYAMRIWLDRRRSPPATSRWRTSRTCSAARTCSCRPGRLESDTREFSLRTNVGLDKEQDFRALVIGRSPTNQLIRLGEVADVRLAAEDERSIMNTDGKPGVGIQVEAQSKANMLDVADGMKKAMARVIPTLPKGMSLVINMDNSISIQAALHEVVIALALAFVSVLIVIYAFLGSLRATLIPAITIPVSIVATFTAMYALGYTINVLTLLALVLAIGLVVDDAIVVLENIFRRAEEGEPTVVAAINGSKEIGFAVIATTLTLAAVFIPISFLPGDIGRLFREFGFTLAASVLFSALIALTLTPMLASKANLDQVKHNKVAEAIDRFFTRVSSWYERRLRNLIRRPWLIVAGVGVLMVGGGLTFHFLPTEFAPMADVGRTVVFMEAPEGASFEYTTSNAAKLEAIVDAERRQFNDIDRVMLRLPGNFSGGGDVNSARVFLLLKDWHERTRSAHGNRPVDRAQGECDSGRAHQHVLAGRTGSRLRQADPGVARWAGLRTARRLVEAAHGAGQPEPRADADRHELQGAQAADPRVRGSQSRGGPRRVAADDRQHARDDARLAHRDDVCRSRPRVQRHSPEPRGRARHDHRPHQHPGALGSHRAS